MSKLHYTTIDSTTTGRASYFFRSLTSAQRRCDELNARAIGLGIKAQYETAEHDGKGIDPKDIRD